MPVTRRSFLVGAGSIITASFIRQVSEFVADTRSPMLVPPSSSERVIFYEQCEDHWRLHLGVPQFVIPEPPLLIENLRWHGHALDTQAEIDSFCISSGWTEAELHSPMNGWDWETQWEHNLNPEAQAFRLLSEHDIFPRKQRGTLEGRVIFEEYSNPMSNWRWVEVHDHLSLSLLQARVNELSLGIAVTEFVTE